MCFAVSVNSLRSQSIDYQVVFSDDWKKAMLFEKENRSWMEPLVIKNDIPYPLAIAVIFPELVRYSALRDKMEIVLLKTLYINLGEEYANFSIGQFQMKPSFAEMIREHSTGSIEHQTGIRYKKKSDFKNITNYRKSIVMDLENPETEFNYLITFLKICEKRFNTDKKNDLERVMFLATAYNYGLDKSADKIEKMVGKRYFNTRLVTTENYSYADVSTFWYKKFLSEK